MAKTAKLSHIRSAKVQVSNNCNRHEIRQMVLAKLAPADYNPRQISEAALAGLRASVQRFGCVQPLVFNKRTKTLVGGHQRLKVLLAEGVEVCDVVVVDLTPIEEKALNVALNSHAISGEFTEQLDFLLDEIRASIPDLYEALLLDELRLNLDPGMDGLCDPDEVPGPPDEATSEHGDLWLLGEHRLFVGDSGSQADLDRLLDGASVQLVNTDPPYNVKVEPRSNNAIAAGNSSFPEAKKRTHHQGFDVARQGEKKKTSKKLRAKDRQLLNDFVTDEAFEAMLLAWFGNASRVMIPGAGFYIWGGYANVANYPPALIASDLYFSQSIIWDKQHPVLTRKDFMGAHEWCFYGWKKGAAHRWFGPNNATDLWHVKKINPASMEHLTAKPAELAERAMQYSSRPGENVLDLFGGSGSTLIAAERQGRRAFLMELDPLYCDVICDRFQRFSGKPAVLERTGTSPIPMKPREDKMR